jgi:hypothetical protein
MHSRSPFDVAESVAALQMPAPPTRPAPSRSAGRIAPTRAELLCIENIDGCWSSRFDYSMN